MTLGLVRVTVKDNQGSGTGGNFSSEPEMKMSRMKLALGAGLWLCGQEQWVQVSLLPTFQLTMVRQNETKGNKRNQTEPNQTVVFLKRVITFNATWTFNTSVSYVHFAV